MNSGIYGYYDNLKDKIIYIGQSQHLQYRNNAHRSPAKYNEQQINRILQNNPRRYSFHILKECDIDMLDYWEITLIALFNPKFNFTNGGKTIRGYKHTEKAKNKISSSLKGHIVSKETRQKISHTKRNTSNVDISGKNNAFYGQKHSDEAKAKMRQAHLKRNKTGIYRVSKRIGKNYKKGFRWVYRCPEDSGIRQISSYSLSELKIKVEEKGLEWIILDIKLAMQSFNDDNV